ncbi:barstar family protein [Alishewanella sp. d11]|uniref:barstar family protein n=1 Tax=Alishewanella sp. d11 TaxID=3414030 RepID=UPI003BF8710F
MNLLSINSRITLLGAVAPADVISLTANSSVNRESILNSLQTSFQFPDYFGGNFDAAYDLLLDQVDTLKQATVWRFSIDSKAAVDEQALACWQQLMEDLIDYASVKGIELDVELYIKSC